MFEAFRLNGSVGGDMSVDLNDTLATKQALHSLGHFRTPSYGAKANGRKQRYEMTAVDDAQFTRSY